MTSAVAMGATVFCCMNKCISGRIQVMRKHTGDIHRYLQDSLILAFHKAMDSWSELKDDIASMEAVKIDNDDAYRMIGQMWGRGVLKPQQMTQVKQRWFKPAQEEFEPRTYWSLYNAVTDVYKKLPPSTTMQNHLMLHEFTRDHVLKTPDALLTTAGTEAVYGASGDIAGLRDDLGLEGRTRNGAYQKASKADWNEDA
jgi:hypothetical protein